MHPNMGAARAPVTPRDSEPRGTLLAPRVVGDDMDLHGSTECFERVYFVLPKDMCSYACRRVSRHANFKFAPFTQTGGKRNTIGR